MTHDTLSSRINSKKEGINSLLAAAAADAGRISCAIQEVAGTEACKGVQINGLKKWSTDNGYWIADHDLLGEFSDRGSENEVYMDSANQLVNKLNDFRYADDNLTPFFKRIEIHNRLFPDCEKVVNFVSLNFVVLFATSHGEMRHDNKRAQSPAVDCL
ncbi:MAG: hypothetical protein NC338_07435 [Firmicutes bacterium]|nr:hypothetical protein [Bacillota bacterium]